MTTTFFGLYGVSSPLPGFYTEELLDDEWDEQSARKDFLDVIHNHIYPLLYQSWLKYKFSHNVVEFENQNYSEIIYNLIGLGEAYRRDEKSYGGLLKYSGLLSLRVKSQLGLKTILQDRLSDYAVDVVPFVERKVPIVRSQRCQLGRQNTTLGIEACIGQEVKNRSGKFSIELGPLNLEQFTEITQKNDTINAIRGLLKIYLVQPLECNINLLLEPGAIMPACLGSADRSILGGNCWLNSTLNDSVESIPLIALDA